MKNKEHEGILRVFLPPRDWRKKGNMEFDELLAICLSYPEVGKEEVISRIDLWYRELLMTRHVLTTLAVIISLPLITFFFTSTLIIQTLLLTTTSSITVAMYLVIRRKKAIRDKLENLYGWLLLDVPYPTSRVPVFMEHAFISRSEKMVNKDLAYTKEMTRAIGRFGNYSHTTLSN
ncbi:MAG: hypothetical protein ACLQQ4_18050 [Bacteroidia bacterium]